MKRFLRGLLLIVILIVCLAIWSILPWYGALVAAIVLALWLALTRGGRRTLSVTGVGLATLPSRWGASSVIVFGIAGVVGVLVALLAMGEGLQATLQGTGNDGTAIVLRGGSQAEASSVLLHDDVVLIAQASGIARDAQGHAIASPELLLAANLPKKDGQDANISVRGVGPEAWAVRPNLHIIAGRKFTPGTLELDVGKGVMRQFAGMAIGSYVQLANQRWKVVGEFDSGDAFNSEIWADRDTIAPIYHRGASSSSVTVKLTSPAAFSQFKAALAANPQLKVDAETTHKYFADQSGGINKVIKVVGTTIAIIMAIGAVFGALNSMYAAVATRSREIATLRAVGFRGTPVVVSVLIETMLLALAGGVLGAFVAWAIFGHYTASTSAGGGFSFTQMIFQFRVTPELVWNGLKWALAIGFVGGLFPAVRAARLPVTTALREL
ncbi:MAG TPA: ABC transporter permease [Rhodanobacteraceae bacterium]|nr:ABC transporter permease [Rhodanobacteraceae bacterium]